MSLFLILLAAGDSKRLKSRIPKPFQLINNKTLLEHALSEFENINKIKKIIVVYNKKHKKYLNTVNLKNVEKVIGGANRQESTLRALKKIKNMKCSKVLIHDVARPNISKRMINKIISYTEKKHAVIPIIKINDATKRVKGKNIFKNINRDGLRFAQTPQGYTFKKIYNKHLKYKKKIFDDDSALFTSDKEKVFTIIGSRKNIKITDKEDLKIFQSFKKNKTFYGIGFDIHRLVKGNEIFLGGIKIPFRYGLEGHSDSDPALHALIDSLLGACKLGDIGSLFSDKNKKYKNIRSTVLLKKVVKKIEDNNFLINNIDINIITQKPKIKKHSKKMINLLSQICKIKPNQINIKGKTTEKLGIIGKEQAIASEVISSVIKND